jgi:hypothetical protein
VVLERNRKRRKLLTEMWLAYEKFAKYLNEKEYIAATSTDPDMYDKVVDDFVQKFIACHQEGNVTHYMVRPTVNAALSGTGYMVQDFGGRFVGRVKRAIADIVQDWCQ